MDNTLPSRQGENTMKLSKLQTEVIKLIQEGWELGTYRNFKLGIDISLQKNGLGRGGKAKRINANTFWSLVAKGLIEEVPNQSWAASPKRYRLTQKGIVSVYETN